MLIQPLVHPWNRPSLHREQSAVPPVLALQISHSSVRILRAVSPALASRHPKSRHPGLLLGLTVQDSKRRLAAFKQNLIPLVPSISNCDVESKQYLKADGFPAVA
mmetsp:Transcript_48714/g.76067  ORF Transcript_48714/g.76067 Transcript_48714/m.76067 type:complete len:105 (+) Transcript_48714:637-951(+)